MTPPNINVDRDALAAFCRRWRVRGLELFGSATRSDFRPDSDIDLLVDFEPNPGWGLFEHEAMRLELCELFGREVDLVTRRAVEQSDNWIRRRAILESAVPFHVT